MSICISAPRSLRVTTASRLAHIRPSVTTWFAGAAIAGVLLLSALALVPTAPADLSRLPGEVVDGIQVISAHAERESGFVTIVGEARNESTRTAEQPEAVVELVGSDGLVRSVETALAETASLRPGGRGTFRVLLRDAPEVHAYRVHVRPLLP